MRATLWSTLLSQILMTFVAIDLKLSKHGQHGHFDLSFNWTRMILRLIIKTNLLSYQGNKLVYDPVVSNMFSNIFDVS